MSLMSKLGWVLLLAPLTAFAAWSTPTDISASGVTSWASNVAINSTGNGASTWTIWDGTSNRIVASIYTGTWSTPVTLSGSGLDSFTPRIGIDDAGNAIVIWGEYNLTNFLVKGAIYTSSTTSWSSVFTLSDTGYDSVNPYLSVNPNGDAVVLWATFDGSYLGKSVDYVSGSWGTVQTFSSTGEDVSDLRFDLSDAGNGVAVWSTFDGTNFVIKTSEYSAGTWSSPVQISNANTDAANPEISMNALGDGMAVWAQANGQWDIVEKAFISGVWDTSPTTLSNNNSPFYARVGYNNAGNAIVIWHDFDNSGNIIVYGRGYDASTTTWGSIRQVSTTGQSSDFSSKVKLNNESVAVAISVWAEFTGSTYVVTSSQYTFSTDTWSTPVAVSSLTDDSLNVALDLNDDGDAITTYESFDGVDWSIQAAIGSF